MIGWRDLAAAVVLAGLLFTATRALVAREDGGGRHDLRRTFATIQSTPDRIVCPARDDCLPAPAEYTLFIFVRNGDCAGSLHDAVVVEEVRSSLPEERFTVVALVEDMDPAEAGAFGTAAGIGYPVWIGLEGLPSSLQKVRPRLGNRPIKLLVHRSGREVGRWQSVPEIDSQRTAADQLRALVEGDK